jgi:hypothetical protein
MANGFGSGRLDSHHHYTIKDKRMSQYKRYFYPVPFFLIL